MRVPNALRSPRNVRTSAPKWWPSDATSGRRLWVALLLLIASIFAALLASRRAFHRVLPFAGPHHAGTSIGRQAFEAAFRAQKPAGATTLGDEDLAGGSAGIAVNRPWTYETDGVWDPPANHDAPITELFVKSCAWPPSFYDVRRTPPGRADRADLRARLHAGRGRRPRAVGARRARSAARRGRLLPVPVRRSIATPSDRTDSTVAFRPSPPCPRSARSSC